MSDRLRQLNADHARFGEEGLPDDLERYVLETYGLSLASSYAGLPIRNPFGKASGQLSLTTGQIERDTTAGLGFVVLKTVIAEDATGEQSMKAWAIPATKMSVEPIVGTREDVRGVPGWTVTWKGRGWSGSFEEYLAFFRDAIRIGAQRTLIVPSVKYHLPKPGESHWRTSEYEFTTAALVNAWRGLRAGPMPLEKDFSPTLAGDASFSSVRETILAWLREVPRILHRTSVGRDIRIGLKLFNAAMTDDFQREIVSTCNTSAGEARAHHLIYGNRLFDPARTCEGTTGVAYGGPDLSDRNLSVLRLVRPTLPLSATGDILTGRTAFEYLKLGATSFQMHTLFQLPDTEFSMRGGTRTARALHRLLFDPATGFIAAYLEAQQRLGLPDGLSVSGLAERFSE